LAKRKVQFNLIGYLFGKISKLQNCKTCINQEIVILTTCPKYKKKK